MWVVNSESLECTIISRFVTRTSMASIWGTSSQCCSHGGSGVLSFERLVCYFSRGCHHDTRYCGHPSLLPDLITLSQVETKDRSGVSAACLIKAVVAYWAD